MTNNSSHDLLLDSDIETDVLKSLGISPRIPPHKSLTPKHFVKHSKPMSPFKTRKQSMTVTSQRLFEYDNPYQKTSRQNTVNESKPKRVSVGFFVNNQWKGKVVNNDDKEAENFERGFRLRSCSNQDKEIAHATYSISRLLKMRQKLRKSSLISQQLINFNPKQIQQTYSKSRNIKTEPDSSNNYYKKRNSDKKQPSTSPEKYQLLRSLKKGQTIRRRTHSKNQFPKCPFIPVLSYRSTENFGITNYSSTQLIKLNIEAVKTQQASHHIY